MNKLRLILYKLGLLESKSINKNYKLIEDFNYTYPYNRRSQVSQELQYYKPNNVAQWNDTYEFIIKKEHCTDNGWWNPDNIEFEYSSGMLHSKEQFLYGTFEAEIFIPKGYGLWSAMWLVGFKDDEPKRFCEIDIFEYYGKEHKYTYNTHAGPDYKHNIYGKSDGIVIKELENSWNKYRCEWTKDKIKLYLNDKLVGVRTSKQIDIPMSLIINMAIEKNIGNKLDKYLPTIMMVKNIRYYGLDK